MQFGSVCSGLQAFTQFTVGQHFGDFREYFEMPVCRSLGHEKENQEVDGLVIWRVKSDSLRHAHHRSERIFQTLDAPMRNGHAMTKARGA